MSLNYRHDAVKKSEGLVAYCTKPPTGVSLADYRFLKFIAFVHLPITEEKIVIFYKENVQRNAEAHEWSFEKKRYVLRDYKPQEIRLASLNWFDRSLGRTLRKGILTQIAKDKIQSAINS